MNFVPLSAAGFRLPDGWFRRTLLHIRHKRRARDIARQIRITAIELDRLDDQILRDIGLARGSIEAALHERALVERSWPRF